LLISCYSLLDLFTITFVSEDVYLYSQMKIVLNFLFIYFIFAFYSFHKFFVLMENFALLSKFYKNFTIKTSYHKVKKFNFTVDRLTYLVRLPC